jgi:hypothetical protein
LSKPPAHDRFSLTKFLTHAGEPLENGVRRLWLHLRCNPGGKAMKKLKKDPVREERIHNEAIVDAGPDEQAMSWYYYLESKIVFPFQARCVAAKPVSPLRKGETAEVVCMAPEDACMHDMLVQIRWWGRKIAVPFSQLDAIDSDEVTKEAIGDWHYWVSQGYLL